MNLLTHIRRLLLCLATIFSLGTVDDLWAAEQRPNIVFILSDDQAWTDYGFMGHPDIKTPHLDKLASRSLVFERGMLPFHFVDRLLLRWLRGSIRFNTALPATM